MASGGVSRVSTRFSLAGLCRSGRSNPSCEAKFSCVNKNREIFVFPVELTTSRFGNHFFCFLFVSCHSVYSGRYTTPFRLIWGCTSRVTQKERLDRKYICTIFHLPSAVLTMIFYREKDSAVPFPCRPWSRTLCTHDRIVLHLLGMMREKIPVRVTAPRFEPTSQRQKVSRLPTEPPGRPVGLYSARTYM